MKSMHVCEEVLKASKMEKWACVELYEFTDNERKGEICTLVFVMVAVNSAVNSNTRKISAIPVKQQQKRLKLIYLKVTIHYAIYSDIKMFIKTMLMQINNVNMTLM